MQRKSTTGLFVFLLFFSTTTTLGNESSLGGALGTDGFGPQVAFRMSDIFTMRMGLVFMPMDIDVDSEGIKYEIGLDQVWLPLLLDYEVGDSNFRTTAGLVLNLNGITAEYTPTENVEVGEQTYTPEQLGHIEGEIDFNFLSPYLGIGLGIPVSGVSGFSICLDGGVIFSRYNCNLESVGGSLPEAMQEELEENLQMASDSLKQKLNILNTYPRISVAVMYSF